MKFYMAGAFALFGSSKLLANIHQQALFSFYGESEGFLRNQDLFTDVFMDSGAFSAKTQGAKIDIKKYSKFLDRHKHKLTVYANLDVMHDAEGTRKNQEWLEKQGHSPLPVFHITEDIEVLDDYVGSYDYIALGGIALDSQKIAKWLNHIFNKYPDQKFHGFGVGDIGKMNTYPFYSCDSTTWFMGQKYGILIYSDGSTGHYNEMSPKRIADINSKGFSKEVIHESYNARNIFNLLSIKDAMFRLDHEKSAEDFNDITEEFE